MNKKTSEILPLYASGFSHGCSFLVSAFAWTDREGVSGSSSRRDRLANERAHAFSALALDFSVLHKFKGKRVSLVLGSGRRQR